MRSSQGGVAFPYCKAPSCLAEGCSVQWRIIDLDLTTSIIDSGARYRTKSRNGVVGVKIDSYSFGRMVIEGEEYRDDLMICGDEVKPGWFRKEGHRLSPEDLGWIVEENPDLLIVGKGSSGRMKVTDRARDYLEERGIEIRADRTDEAVKQFNALHESEEESLVAAAYHLTC